MSQDVWQRRCGAHTPRYPQKHLLMFIAIATIIVNILAAVAVIVWGVIYQRTP